MAAVAAGVVGRDEEVAAIAAVLSSVGEGTAGIVLTIKAPAP
jgi:hypothetical protein